MNEEELKDICMGVYLQHGEREFPYEFGMSWYKLTDVGLLVEGWKWKTKLTPKGLKLIREHNGQ